MTTAHIDDTGIAGLGARITSIEVIIPTLATKADLERLHTDFERGQKENRAWMLGTVLLALFVGIVGAGSFFMRGNTPQPAVPQAPIIVYATPPPAQKVFSNPSMSLEKSLLPAG